MPEISRFFEIIISIFYDDHNPPHFHARYGDYDALIKMDKLVKIAEGNNGGALLCTKNIIN